jgi:hypothetical protein
MIRREEDMTRVLLVGLQPEAVDYSDPALPPDMDARKIQAGIEVGLKQMTDRGWQADACLIQPDATAGPTVERRLGATTYDVIGAGVRLRPKNLLLFETIVNTVRKAAPNTSIAFNTVPGDRGHAGLVGYPPLSRQTRARDVGRRRALRRPYEAVAPGATALGFCSQLVAESGLDQRRIRYRDGNGADGARVAG